MTDFERQLDLYRELGARRMQVYQLREAIRAALEDNRSDFSARRILADTLRAVGADLNTAEDAIRQREEVK